MASPEVLKKHGFDVEEWEMFKSQFVKTGFPKPIKHFRIGWETFNMSIEEVYFWPINYMREGGGYLHSIKTEDVFAASENSAFFGVSQQRIGLQQDKISQFLATIGKMIKELFQLVRELRIIDERLDYYEQSFKGVESAEITLKGIWIDMVEGGAKNPASVFGMAREVQFTSLPDLFFSTHPKTEAEVDEYVDKTRGGFNVSVRNVLKRKLKMYMIWKKRTYEEIKTRRIFTLKYMKQHNDIIKMYMEWVRPYLRHVRRLTLDQGKMASPDMLSAFEGSMIEAEYLLYKPAGSVGTKPEHKFNSCLLFHYLYRTRPSMSYQQEGYQRGPLHVGRVEIDMMAFVWTDAQIEAYKKMKLDEDFELMKSIDESVKAAMEALGDELQKYLKEAETTAEKVEEKKEEEEKKSFWELLLGPSAPKKEAKPKIPSASAVKEKAKIDELRKNEIISKSRSTLKSDLFNCYKNFKKAHGMVMW